MNYANANKAIAPISGIKWQDCLFIRIAIRNQEIRSNIFIRIVYNSIEK